jgi:hypothetical protein
LKLARIEATPEELQAHEEELRLIDAGCPGGALWRRLDA